MDEDTILPLGLANFSPVNQKIKVASVLSTLSLDDKNESFNAFASIGIIFVCAEGVCSIIRDVLNSSYLF